MKSFLLAKKSIFHSILRMVVLLLFSSTLSIGQPIQSHDQTIDSLEALMGTILADSTKLKILHQLTNAYTGKDPIPAKKYGYEGLNLARKNADLQSEMKFLHSLSFLHSITGEWGLGIELGYEGLKLSEQTSGEENLSFINMIALGFSKQKNYSKVLEWAIKGYYNSHDGHIIGLDINNKWAITMMMAEAYTNLNIPDSAIIYTKISLSFAHAAGNLLYLSHSYARLGLDYSAIAEYDSALYYIRTALHIKKQISNEFGYQETTRDLANLFMKLQLYDSAKIYAIEAYHDASQKNNPLVVLDITKILAEIFEKEGNKVKAYDYLKIHNELNNQFNTLEKVNYIYQLEVNDRQRLEEIKQHKIQAQVKFKNNALLGIIGATMIILVSLFLYSRQRAKLYLQLEKINASLKFTQAQLIQSEKQAAQYHIKQLIASDLHDDVGSTLTSIQLMSKISLLDLNQNSLKVKNYMQTINDQATQLQQSIKDIVWTLQLEQITLDQLMHKSTEIASNLLEPAGILFEINFTQSHDSAVKLTPNQSKNILMIFREALNNIIKHAEAKNVKILWGQNELMIIMNIKDDGNGLVSITEAGNGIKNMKNRGNSVGNFQISGDHTGSHIRLEILGKESEPQK